MAGQGKVLPVCGGVEVLPHGRKLASKMKCFKMRTPANEQNRIPADGFVGLNRG